MGEGCFILVDFMSLFPELPREEPFSKAHSGEPPSNHSSGRLELNLHFVSFLSMEHLAITRWISPAFMLPARFSRSLSMVLIGEMKTFGSFNAVQWLHTAWEAMPHVLN